MIQKLLGRKTAIDRPIASIEHAILSNGLRPMRPRDLLLAPQNISYVDVLNLTRNKYIYEKDIEIAIAPLFIHAARLFQLLPASKHSHHTHVGGLLLHSLEVADVVTSGGADLQTRGLRDPVHENLERAARQATIIGAGLFHDVGKLVTDMRIYGFRKAFPEDPITYDPTLENLVSLPLFDWLLKNDIEHYCFEFVPNRKMNAHSSFSFKFLRRLLGSMGLLVSEKINRALSDESSFLHQSLLESTISSDRRSVEEYRKRHGNRETDVLSQLVSALLYAAKETCVLDAAPVVDGRIFLSVERCGLIARSLPNYEDFADIRNSPSFEHLLLSYSVCEKPNSGTSEVYNGIRGLFVRNDTGFCVQLLDEMGHSKSDSVDTGAVYQNIHDSAGVLKGLSPRSRDFLRAILKLPDLKEGDAGCLRVKVAEVFRHYSNSPPQPKTLLRSLMSDGLLLDHQNGLVSLGISVDEVIDAFDHPLGGD